MDENSPVIEKNLAVVRRRVLVVEDTVQLREALVRYLSQSGLEVIPAADGEEGLSKAKESSPNLILADIFMPRLGGIDMVKQIRATDWGANIPVMLLSNFSLDRDSLESVKQLGKLRYMTKSDSSLKEVVRACMDMMDRYAALGNTAVTVDTVSTDPIQ